MISEEVENSEIRGFLLNKITVKQNILLKIFDFSGRHWSVVRKTGAKFVFLDSNEKEPIFFREQR